MILSSPYSDWLARLTYNRISRSDSEPNLPSSPQPRIILTGVDSPDSARWFPGYPGWALRRGEVEVGGASSLPDCALTALASHQLQLYRNRNHSMKTHRGSRGHLNTSLEEVRSRAPVSSNISLRSPLERSVRLRGINTRERALISGVINRWFWLSAM